MCSSCPLFGDHGRVGDTQPAACGDRRRRNLGQSPDPRDVARTATTVACAFRGTRPLAPAAPIRGNTHDELGAYCWRAQCCTLSTNVRRSPSSARCSTTSRSSTSPQVVQVLQPRVGLPPDACRGVVVEQQPSVLGDAPGQPQRCAVEYDEVGAVRQLDRPGVRCVAAPPGSDVEIAVGPGLLAGGATAVHEREARARVPQGLCHLTLVRAHGAILARATVTAAGSARRRRRWRGRTAPASSRPAGSGRRCSTAAPAPG
jgi:hypothetical protein